MNCQYDDMDYQDYDCEYDERYEGLTTKEIEDLQEDERSREAYEKMMRDSYYW